MSSTKLTVVGGVSAPPPGVPLADDEAAPLLSGGGGGTFDGMNDRITRLEEQMVGVRESLVDIKESLKVLPTLASKSDISAWKLQWTALLVATFAIIVGSIIGGLGWLETHVARVQPSPAAATAPIIIQVPIPLPAPTQPSAAKPG